MKNGLLVFTSIIVLVAILVSLSLSFTGYAVGFEDLECEEASCVEMSEFVSVWGNNCSTHFESQTEVCGGGVDDIDPTILIENIEEVSWTECTEGTCQTSSSGSQTIGCSDFEEVIDVEYGGVCFDSISSKVDLDIALDEESLPIDYFEFTFVDADGFKEGPHTVVDTPEPGGTKVAYGFFVDGVPDSLLVSIFADGVCEGNLQEIVIENCGVDVSGGETDPKIPILVGVPNVENIFPQELVESEEIVEMACVPTWDCGEWGPCVDGFESRDCQDVTFVANDVFVEGIDSEATGCFPWTGVSTNNPEVSRSCEVGCVEDWDCSWSACEDGLSVPTCQDKNECGTSFDIPKAVRCNVAPEPCVPNMEFSEWSACGVDPLSVVGTGRSIEEISNYQTRTGNDLNGCGASVVEKQECVENKNIFTKQGEKWGEDTLTVYDASDNTQVATIVFVKEEVHVVFDDSSRPPHCNDGIQNEGEKGIDCGGKCLSCSEWKAFVRSPNIGQIVSGWFTELFD